MLTADTDSAPDAVERYFQRADIGLDILETIAAAVVAIDATGVIRLWNHGAARLADTPAADVVGRNILEFLPDDRAAVNMVWQQLLQQEQLSRAELELRLPGHRRLAVGFSASLLQDADGTPTGAVLIARGLNEQKKCEQLMAALVQSSRDAALSHTPDEIFGTISSALRPLRLWTLVLMMDESRTALEICHVNIAHMLTDESQESTAALRRITDADIQSELIDFQIPLAHANALHSMQGLGQPYYYKNIIPPVMVTFPPLLQKTLEVIANDMGFHHGVVAPLRNDGRIVGEVLIGGDVQIEDVATLGLYANQLSGALTNAQLRMSLEERMAKRTATLLAERERLQAILDNMTDAVVSTSADGTIEFVNSAWERLHGLSQEEVRGRPLCQYVALAQYHKLVDSVGNAVDAGKMWHGELINGRPDGSEYYSALTLVPAHDERGVLQSFVGVERDITHEREAIKANDRFVSDMSHELRTPLTNIKFYLSLLERGKPERRSQYMDTLKRETNRLHNLIEDLLAVSRFDQERTAFELVPVNLEEFLRKLIADRSQLIAEHGLNLQFCSDGSYPPVSADPSHLKHMVSNLLTNAINYTPRDGTVTVRLVRLPDPERAVMFQIADTGIGINEEEQSRIFERFFRGNAGRESQTPGTGLGLSIVQEIVTRLQGTIHVESIPERGTTVTVRLPVWETDSEA